MRGPLPVLRSAPVKLGRGLRVRFTLVDGGVEAEWLSRLPTPQDRKVLPAYRAARNAFLCDVAKKTGLTVAVVEV